MGLSYCRTRRVALALAAIGSMLAVSGCFAMVAGTKQDIEFKSDLPGLDVHIEGETCHVPCTLTIGRRAGVYYMQAMQNGRIVAEGPICSVGAYTRRDCDSTQGNGTLLALAAVTDGLLFVPGIIDLGTGWIVWRPDIVVIEPAAYQLDDPCFDTPVRLRSQGPTDDPRCGAPILR